MSEKDPSEAASVCPYMRAKLDRNEEMARERRVKLVELVQKLNLPTFMGVEGPEAAKEFINRAEKIFNLLECTEEEKVMLATYSLQSEADAWWEASRNNPRLDYIGNAWEQFREAFLGKYFPFTVREDKAREFELLQQTEEMSVDQYEAKLLELSRYDPEIVNTTDKRARKFERGLLQRIRIPLAAFMMTSYGEVYQMAQMIEKTQRECSEHEGVKGKRPAAEGGSKVFSREFKKGRFFQRDGSSDTHRYSGPVRGIEVMSASPQPSRCLRCGQWHSGWQCSPRSGGSVVCYQCGQPGHIRWHCPQNQWNAATAVSNVSRGRGRGGAQSSKGFSEPRPSSWT